MFKDAGRANFFVWEVRTPRAEFWDELENRVSGIRELDKELKKGKRLMAKRLSMPVIRRLSRYGTTYSWSSTARLTAVWRNYLLSM